jgi:hypothetical protein
MLAQHLLYAGKANSYQILVLEAGRHSLPKRFQNLPLQRQPIPRCGNWLRKCSPRLASGGGHRLEAKAFLPRITSIRARGMRRSLFAKDQERCAVNCITLSVRRMPYLLE